MTIRSELPEVEVQGIRAAFSIHRWVNYLESIITQTFFYKAPHKKVHGNLFPIL